MFYCFFVTKNCDFKKQKYIESFLGNVLNYSCGPIKEFAHILVRIVRCRIARTRLIPLLHFQFTSQFQIFSFTGQYTQNAILNREESVC